MLFSKGFQGLKAYSRENGKALQCSVLPLLIMWNLQKKILGREGDKFAEISRIAKNYLLILTEVSTQEKRILANEHNIFTQKFIYN